MTINRQTEDNTFKSCDFLQFSLVFTKSRSKLPTIAKWYKPKRGERQRGVCVLCVVKTFIQQSYRSTRHSRSYT